GNHPLGVQRPVDRVDHHAHVTRAITEDHLAAFLRDRGERMALRVQRLEALEHDVLRAPVDYQGLVAACAAARLGGSGLRRGVKDQQFAQRLDRAAAETKPVSIQNRARCGLLCHATILWVVEMWCFRGASGASRLFQETARNSVPTVPPPSLPCLMMPGLLADLNEAQREAVTHPGGPLLVLAGAGSGKTRVITRRIAWLASQEIAPEEVPALTFSKKAAEEMRARAEELLTGAYEELHCSTFHAFCARLLREEGLDAGLDPFFHLLTPAEGRAFPPD